MRTYEPNSTRARARLLALSMVVDGHIDASELKVLDEAPVLHGLQLDMQLFRDVLDELCSDMLRTAVRDGVVEIGTPLLDRLLADITDPELQGKMLGAMWKIVHADEQLADAESILLARACGLWWPDYPNSGLPALAA
jgi:uncharacterized tellurite resistance protein B-like protein